MYSTESLSKRAIVAAALNKHQAALGSFVRSRVWANEVEDVTQIAAARAIEHARSLDDPDRVLAWLYRIHRNVVVDTIRKRTAQQRLIDPAASIPDVQSPDPAHLCDCSVSQVKRMRPSYAAILALVDMGDSTLKEAARTLGVSINNATVRLHRAREALKKQMLNHCGVKNYRDCADCRCADDGCCAI